MEKVTLNEKLTASEEILSTMRALHDNDADWKSGKTWSLVYYAGDELLDFLKQAYGIYFCENGLNPLAFPSLKKFETEVVSMAAFMLGGNETTSGSMTSGGTESILMAVKCAREWAKVNRPKATAPEMILPITIHPAFEKAANYFGVKAVHAPIGEDCRVVVSEMKKLVNENTILIVGSAPAYPHGVIDPIPDIAAIAKENGILCHVDSCVGGFILPFCRKLGYPIPPFDFAVDGVTSISADIHKYGFAAKGASVVLYRNQDIRRHQFFTYTDWPGGLYASPTVTGTRPGGAIAAAWAVMKHLGNEGYMGIAKRTMTTARALMDGITAVPGLRVIGKPDMSIFAFTTDDFNIYALGDVMERYGWKLDRQQLPACLHMMVTPAHEKIVDQFLADLRKSVEEVKTTDPNSIEGSASLYGMMASLPDRGEVKVFLNGFLDQIFDVGA